MPKFAANLSMMFNEVEFLDRFEAAAKAGFTGIEYLFPYDYEKAAIQERLQAHGLTQVLFNLPPGDWAAGERGLTSLPDKVGAFQDSVGTALDYAKALGCTRLHALSGMPPQGTDPERAAQTYVENLKFAADTLKPEGIGLVIEPINTRDMPGIFLTGTRQAIEAMDAVGADNLKLQYDCYHMQIMEGDLTMTLERLADRIGHIQIADVPARHEPGTGEIDYTFLFDCIDRIGYAGWIGCEYKPAGETVAGLGWFVPYRGKQ